MEEDVLKRIGLTDGETKVYLALIQLGQSSVGPIVKSSGVSASKAYIILDKLAKKGLISHTKIGGNRQFSISSFNKVFDMLLERRREIEHQEEQFKKILPNLVNLEKQRKKQYEAQIFEDYEGIKAYFNDLLSGMKKGEERLVFGAISGYPLSEPAQRFFQSFHRRWVSAGLKTKMIFNRDMRGDANTKFYSGMRLTEVRYLPKQTFSSVGTQKDKIDILIWTKETALLFAIKSKEVADSFRDYFEVLWKSARR